VLHTKTGNPVAQNNDKECNCSVNAETESSLSRLYDNNFLVIGRAGMDFYADPPGTKTENASNFFACVGGSSANICVAICKHGGNSALVTRVSDDSVGRFCINELQQYGVDHQFVKAQGGEKWRRRLSNGYQRH